MKLYVDDIRNAPDQTWSVARTVNAAISFIDTFQPDVISLDHDISHQIIMSWTSRPYPCEETFTAVAYYIKAKYADRILARRMEKDVGVKHTCLSADCPERTGGECKTIALPKIVIHTSNPAGAVKMAGILADFEVERKESSAANRLESVV